MASLQADVTDAATKTFSGAPQWAAVILIVAGFLTYLYMHEQFLQKQYQRQDLVTVQRIDSCHDVQDRSIDTMEKLSEVLANQAAAFNSMAEAMSRLEETIRERP